MAIDKFLASVGKGTPVPDLTKAISEAYAICVDSERLLKDAIIKHVSEQADFLINFSGEKEEYNELMESTPGFAADVTRVLAKQMQATRKRRAESPPPESSSRARPVSDRAGRYRYACPDGCGTARTFIFTNLNQTASIQCPVTTRFYHLTGWEWQRYYLGT